MLLYFHGGSTGTGDGRRDQSSSWNPRRNHRQAEFDPQLTGRGKKGTQLERKNLCQGERIAQLEEESASSRWQNGGFAFEKDNEWEPIPPLPSAFFPTQTEMEREQKR